MRGPECPSREVQASGVQSGARLSLQPPCFAWACALGVGPTDPQVHKDP